MAFLETQPFFGMTQRLGRKCSWNISKRLKLVGVGCIPVLQWKVTACPIVFTTCFFTCCNLIEKRFALQLYLLKSNLKLLFYYPFILSTSEFLEWLLTRLRVLQKQVLVGLRICLHQVTNHRLFHFLGVDGRLYLFHTLRGTLRKAQVPRKTLEEACNTFEEKCLKLYEENTKNYQSASWRDTSTPSNPLVAQQGPQVVQPSELEKDYYDRIYWYLLEAKKNIEYCIAERFHQEDLRKTDSLSSSATSTGSNLKEDRRLFLSFDVLAKCEMIGGRIAMPALLLCFLREYLEPGHPMLTSQILSLLPLHVYGDIAPSGYNPYITYISGLLKSETQTRVTEMVHVLFNLLLSSLFTKLNIASNILKILLGT